MLLPLIASAVTSTAMPPNPSGRIFVQVKEVTMAMWFSVDNAFDDFLEDEFVRRMLRSIWT